ncbi:putative iron-regulated protein [Allopseudospirillum japonicum]|uniref:Putative iron-regulated protein n=1 Tax=Allopseudospirillum japonicum TaxID=64971 RepID=A0A1H6U415_9GAMM|nr:imelysin family protein [Allopseudospirillum japonicum]SEI87053.1 putative iron-regulated protein [Allopseudospirillum japonicum]
MQSWLPSPPKALTFCCALALGTGLPAISVHASTQAPAKVQQAAQITADAVVNQYAEVALAVFQDALTSAQALQNAVEALIAQPSAATLETARQAWKQARVPYQQSEVFRFGNVIVDEWEGQLNAWPLDEGLIDYVKQDAYPHEQGNGGALANIIANQSIQVGAQTLDVTHITPELLAELNEIGGSEANVATGYHAIEFLLWGQDLHGFNEGAGERPYTDFVTNDACTGGHCERRVAYLRAATELLIKDLAWMRDQWQPNQADNYRAQLTQAPAQQGLEKMLYGMGSLSLGELAGERMKVALTANSVEDEHDCFSDNTHYSHYYNGLGIQNVYLGRYQRLDGTWVQGPSLAALVAQKNADLDTRLQAQLETTQKRLQTLVTLAEAEGSPVKFDMLIRPGNQEGARVIQDAILALVTQTQSIQDAAQALGIANLNPDTADHEF